MAATAWSATAVWRPPPAPLTLPSGAVHLWRIELDRAPAAWAALEATLSADERARAERFHFPRDRQRFIAARGSLRAILGQYLASAPAQVQFDYHCRCGRASCRHEQRKPALALASRGDGLCFNLSHSANLALCAIAKHAEVGVDLERVEPGLAVLELAERTFAPAELAILRTLEPTQQRRAFYAGWTGKEAYSKALGLGLTLDPSAVIIALAPAAPLTLLAAPGGAAEVSRWSLYALELGPDFAGAVAVEGQHHQLSTWQWPT